MPRLLPVPGKGPKPARIMVVGEAPGRDEDAQGEPFVGRSGAVLRQFTRMYGAFDLDICYVTHLVKELPLKEQGLAKEILPREIAKWAPLLWNEIEEVEPRVIVCMGRFAFRELTGVLAPMEAVHGHAWYPRVYEADRPVTVIPCFHPAVGLRDPSYLAHLAYGLRQARVYAAVQELPWPPKGPAAPFDYKVQLDQLAYDIDTGWRGTRIALDTEGSAATPSALSWSMVPGLAHVIAGPNSPVFRYAPLHRLGELLRRQRPTVLLHYALHDLPVLRAMGLDLIAWGCPIEDTQVKAYLLQLEPQGLKNLALRHLRLQMRDFEEITFDAREDEYRAWLFDLYADPKVRAFPKDHYYEVERYSEKTGKRLKPQPVNCHCGLCESFKRVEAAMVEPPADWEKFAEKIPREYLDLHPAPTTDRVLARMWESPLYHDTLVRYSGLDAGVTLDVGNILDKQLDTAANGRLREVERLDLSVLPMLDRMQTVGLRVDMARYEALRRDLERDLDNLTTAIRDLVDEPDLNPTSRDQLAELLFDKLHIQESGDRLKLTKGKTRPAVDEEVLKTYEDAHPVVPLLLEYSEVRVLLNTFLDPLPGFMREGRVHPRWNSTRVFSGRLSCNDPNLLAFPAHSARGIRVRGLFVADPGFSLFSADLAQIEPRILAHESQDETLLGIFNRGEDIYRQMASLVWNIPAELVSKAQRQGAKVIVLAILYGLSPAGLQKQLTKLGLPITEEQAESLIASLLSRLPGVKKYRNQVWAQTRLDSFVTGPSGRVRYLPGIRLQGDRYPNSYIRAEAERQALNHEIQEGAQACLKRAMARIWRETIPACHKYGVVEPVLQIHDELVFAVKMKDGQERIRVEERILRAMTQEKLSVPLLCEGKWAQDWGGLK